MLSPHLSVVLQETIQHFKILLARCWPWKWWVDFKFCDILNPVVCPSCVIRERFVSSGNANIQSIKLVFYSFQQQNLSLRSRRSSWQTHSKCKRFLCLHEFFLNDASFLYNFHLHFLGVNSLILVVNLKLKCSAIKYSLKWSIFMDTKKYNLEFLSIFMPLGSFSYIKGADHCARPAADLRPLRCVYVVYLSAARVDSRGSRLLFLPAGNAFL